MQVDVTLDPGNAMRIYRYDGRAGDQFYLDFLDGSANGQWNVVNAYGQMTGNVTYIQHDMLALTLRTDGTHYLILDPRLQDSGVTTTSFRMVPFSGAEIATALNETVEGSLALPGQQPRHTSTLSQPARVYLDMLSPANGNWGWRLSGPRGFVDERPFTQSDAADNGTAPLYDLPAGDYVLTISAQSDVTGDYAFALLDTATARPITLGTTEADQLAPGSETWLYRFDAAAGDRYFFNMVSGDWRTRWRLIDPYGREVFDTDLQDVDTVTLLDSGTYLLLIEGRVWSPETRDFAFNVFANPVTAPVRLALEDIPSPDLVIDAFALGFTDRVESGGWVPVTWTIRNAGDADFAGSFSNRVTTRRQDTNEILADLVVPFDGALAQGATATQTASLRLPVGSRRGGADGHAASGQRERGGRAEQHGRRGIEQQRGSGADLGPCGAARSGDPRPDPLACRRMGGGACGRRHMDRHERGPQGSAGPVDGTAGHHEPRDGPCRLCRRHPRPGRRTGCRGHARPPRGIRLTRRRGCHGRIRLHRHRRYVGRNRRGE